MPGIIGGIASVIVAAYKNGNGRYNLRLHIWLVSYFYSLFSFSFLYYRHSDSIIYGPNAQNAGSLQLAGLATTLAIATFSGVLTGYLLKWMQPPLTENATFDDEAWFELSEREKKLD